MNSITLADLEQSRAFIELLLFVVAFCSFVFGSISGWYFRGKYESWYWLKHGVYCDACAPLVDRLKEQGGY